jgi:TonB family protein
MALLAAGLSAHGNADEPASPLAQCKGSPAFAFFPTPAKRLGIYGIATVSFQMDAQGAIRNVQVVEADSPLFADKARQLLASYRCPATSADTATHVIEFQFLYQPCTPLAPTDPSHSIVAVCTTPLPQSSPVRAHAG